MSARHIVGLISPKLHRPHCIGRYLSYIPCVPIESYMPATSAQGKIVTDQAKKHHAPNRTGKFDGAIPILATASIPRWSFAHCIDSEGHNESDDDEAIVTGDL